ncbi:MAG TPA: hypothetical protein VLK37_02950 [Solirubrobacterales bacterium]|nr:hypothetical protein [Solirubrobacterales bacterium]
MTPAQTTDGDLHGLIQHSFAMRVPPEMHPWYSREGIGDSRSLLKGIFEAGHFSLGEGKMTNGWTDDMGGAWEHSLMVATRRTNVIPLRLPFKEDNELPGLFRWAFDESNSGTPPPDPEDWEAFAFGGTDLPRGSTRNDFLLEETSPRADADKGVSQFLCQLLAHRRSQLFGLPLTRSTFNVLLPHATLMPTSEERSGAWLVQPVTSLFHVYARRRFRPVFSFSLFLIPCTQPGPEMSAREMRAEEIRETVKCQWPLASAYDRPRTRPAFEVEGPLATYLEAIAEPALAGLDLSVSGGKFEKLLTLRMFTEATLFATATAMTGGPGAMLGKTAKRTLGDRIVTSLSASRVSSVAVIGPDCAEAMEGTETTAVEKGEETMLEKSLASLATDIVKPLKCNDETLSTYRLDEFLFDRPGYVSAVLPDDRCIVTIGSPRVQKGLETSLLLEAGWTAYMVIGAATATGLIRSVFREIAVSDRSRPELIADIEREAIVDLHETYDIEVTVEAYRKHYRLLRKYLGIANEYKALSAKLEALHRETSTRYEARSEQRLTLLTWAIVILSAFILVGTLVLIFKPGG